MKSKFGWVMMGLVIGLSGVVINLTVNNIIGVGLVGLGLGWILVSSFIQEPSSSNSEEEGE